MSGLFTKDNKATRFQYAMAYIFSLLVITILYLNTIEILEFVESKIVFNIIFYGIFSIVGISLLVFMVWRLNDMGKSQWYILFAFFPIINTIFGIVLCFYPPSRLLNKNKKNIGKEEDQKNTSKIISIYKNPDKIENAKKSSALKMETIAKFIVQIALIATVWILGKDLIYVLSSNGLWSIFGQKLLISFVALVALVATINGKIGIDTKWMHNNYIVFDVNAFSKLTSLIAKVIAILFIVSGLTFFAIYIAKNYDAIINKASDRIEYYMDTERYKANQIAKKNREAAKIKYDAKMKMQHEVNQIAKEYRTAGAYITDNINTTMHNGNYHVCRTSDKTITYVFKKSLKENKFISMEKTGDYVWNILYGNDNYLNVHMEKERILAIYDNNKIIINDLEGQIILYCHEYLKANI